MLVALFTVLFLALAAKFLYLQISGYSNGVPLAAKAAKQHLKSTTIDAKRGSILDSKGEVLAEDTSTFTLAAVLSKDASKDQKTPLHVVDKEKTAEVLAKYLPIKEDAVLKELQKKDKYQVEFGAAGKNISVATKEKIEKAKLPGLIFTRQAERFYPNGVLAAEVIGFAQRDEKTNQLVGKMGLEKQLNDELEGKDGKLNYSTDRMGYILPNSKTNVKPAVDGKNITLTTDKKIQTFLEDTMNSVNEKYHPKNMMAVVANPKTGEILAMSQRPTFNPSTKAGLESKNSGVWQDLPVEYAYEPGSVMKVFSLASAIDAGVYNPNEYYKSGIYKVGDIQIHDHNRVGWGSIPFREGLERSSNVAFARLLDKLGTDRFLSYLKKFKFGEKTGVDLPNESSGKIVYNYPVEKVTNVFGQGSSYSMMQMLQAATAVASDGKMKQPHVIAKITDPNTGKTKKTKVKITGQPISAATAKRTREELRYVIDGENGTGKLYAIPGYDVAGKTGTAQIADPKTGKYMYGMDNYLFSFMGMAPANDPKLIMYVTMQQPQLENGPAGSTGGQAVADIFNPVMKTSLQYMNIKPSTVKKSEVIKAPVVTDKSVTEAKELLEKKDLAPVIIGSGKKIVQQLPKPGTTLLKGQRVVMLTEGAMTMPDMRNWSKDDALKVSEITGIPFEFQGDGYVKSQNVTKGTTINSKSKIRLKMVSPDKLDAFNKNNDHKSQSETKKETDVQENEGIGSLLNG